MKVLTDIALLIKIVFFAVVVGVVVGVILAMSVKAVPPSQGSDPTSTGEVVSTGTTENI